MDLRKKVVEAVGQAKDGVVSKVPEVVGQVKDGVADKVQNINVLEVLEVAMKAPGAKIDREKFLRKELKHRYPKETVDTAIEHNPAYAGIDREAIDKLAKNAIDYETNKATAISFATGLPGGAVALAGVSVDIIQYFVFMLRIIQELAYLYGFEDFHLDEESVHNEMMNEIVFFLGVMFGVQEANTAIKLIADVAGKTVARRLARKALMKGTVYPIVKKVATTIGFRMTKEIFAGGVGRTIPVLGGVITGGLTFASMKPCANLLKNDLQQYPISDPEFYKSGAYENAEPVDITDLYEVDVEDDDDSEAVGYYVDMSTPPPYDISVLILVLKVEPHFG